MEKVLLDQEIFLKQVCECLKENDEAIDKMVDSWRMNYQTARISTLMKELKITNISAQNAIEQIDAASITAYKKREEIRTHVQQIQENPYDILVEQLIFAYKCFCTEYNITNNEQIPDFLKETIIFELPDADNKKHTISASMAKFLIKSPNTHACRIFFMTLLKDMPPNI